MADVKMHECFPTMISEFSFHPDKTAQIQDKIRKVNSGEELESQHDDQTELFLAKQFEAEVNNLKDMLK